MRTRGPVQHSYTAAPVETVRLKGIIRYTTKAIAGGVVKSIPQTWAITRPVTAPSANGAPFYIQGDHQYQFARGGTFTFFPPRYDREMDPSDPTTWQRQYRFS